MFDQLSKGKHNAMVEKRVEEATGVLKAVADDLWTLWVEHVIPNVAFQARKRVVVEEHEEHTKKVCEEVA